MQEILKPVKAKFPDLSYADIWTMAGTQAVQLTGGPAIAFRYGRTDAPDNSQCPANGRLPDASQGAQHLRDVFGRMGFGVSQMEDDSNRSTDSHQSRIWVVPEIIHSSPSWVAVLIQLFLGMLSFGNFFVCKQDKEIVALSGAHTLGSCHRTRSGFDGPWTHNPLKVRGYSCNYRSTCVGPVRYSLLVFSTPV